MKYYTIWGREALQMPCLLFLVRFIVCRSYNEQVLEELYGTVDPNRTEPNQVTHSLTHSLTYSLTTWNYCYY